MSLGLILWSGTELKGLCRKNGKRLASNIILRILSFAPVLDKSWFACGTSIVFSPSKVQSKRSWAPVNILYDTIVPSVVKKYASGKGNADKQLMYDSFKEHTKQDLLKLFDMGKLNNPVTDIVDSYYIAKVGYENFESKK